VVVFKIRSDIGFFFHEPRRKKVSKKILSVFGIVALLAIIPFSIISAQSGGCTVNGVEVPGDPYLIEGTRSADVIDCRTSPTGHHIYADAGSDIVYGSEYDDYIEGHDGNDIEYGMGGNDSIDGGAKDDTIYGGAGNDVLFGGVGSAPASGVGCELQTAGTFKLAAPANIGGSGDDTIYGGDGNDCIDAGTGGGGTDTFVDCETQQ
jgi:Ca2+-binding RTX toxin-like protein